MSRKTNSRFGAVLTDRCERRFELFVDLYLVARDYFVGFVGHADDGLQFVEHRVSHSFFARGSGVRSYAVAAIIRHAYSDIK
jgi:hypothetical protein